jgi:hypothetical protein
MALSGSYLKWARNGTSRYFSLAKLVAANFFRVFLEGCIFRAVT